MVAIVSKTYERLVEITKQLGQPTVHREVDLEQDKYLLEKYAGRSFIWSVREAGTVMTPIGVGVDPFYVQHYVDMATFYHIDHDHKINKVTPEEAVRLMSQQPAFLCEGQCVEAQTKAVQTVLKYGDEKGIWSSSLRPDVDGFWKDWLSFFKRDDNPVMIEFMQKAMSYQAQH